MCLKNMNNYSKEILRVWISSVYLWFGFSQLFDPMTWTAWLPSWVYSLPFDATTFIYMNWWVEVILWIILLIWFKTKLIALLLSIHMTVILFHVWYNDIFVRDFWILIATFVIFLNGKDSLCLDTKMSK